jgi:hypothetical protein
MSKKPHITLYLTAVIGEWGGTYKDSDKVWQDAFAKYLASKCMSDAFYWYVVVIHKHTHPLHTYIDMHVHRCSLYAYIHIFVTLLCLCHACERIYISTYNYRSINPNSGDTGGLLLDDWSTPNTGKLSAMALAQPNPSVFTSAITTTSMCVNYGAFASSACGSTAVIPTTPSTPVVVITPPAPAPAPVPVVVAPVPVTPVVVAPAVTPPAAVTGCSALW